MLILARRKNESILITVPPSTSETTVRVMMVELRKGQNEQPKVRLGIDAPTNVAVDREEIYHSKKKAGQR